MTNGIQTVFRWASCFLAGAALLTTIQSTIAQNKGIRPVANTGQATVTAEKLPEETQPLTGNLNIEKSRIYVRVGKTGLGHEHAVVGQVKEGTVHLGASHPADKIVFDMATFDADGDVARKYFGLIGSTDATTRKQVTENMLGESVLDVANHPTATFIIKSAKKIREQSKRTPAQYQLIGVFVLRGQTRPISVTADAEEESEWIRLKGSFAILQSDYGITPFSKGFGTIGVADRLQIHGDFWVAK